MPRCSSQLKNSTLKRTLKLGQVASDVLGLRGRLMRRALADGAAQAGKLAELAQGKRKSQTAALRQA